MHKKEFMKKYKIGIIGYGGFGRFLHHWWGKLEFVEVVAIADSKTDFDAIGNVKGYRHWEDLVNSDGIDIVSVVTPPSVHAEIAIAAMKAGKHVILEKPVAISLEQADAIMVAKHETGKLIMVDHMLRYNPIIEHVKTLSLSGMLGKLRYAEVANHAQDASLPIDHWFWNRDFSGGIFVEHGVHFIDIINSLTNQKPKSVSGVSHWRNERQQDQVSATVLYDEGLIAQHYHSFSGPGFFEQTTIRLKFDLAKIEITGWIPIKAKISALTSARSKAALLNLPGWETDNIKSISAVEDESRPEGWGNTVNTSGSICAGGIAYEAEEFINGTFRLSDSKGEVYGKCVQDILLDLIHCIEDANHKPRVTIEDAIASLAIAIKATS
jgi:predicted dehydrogenase